MGLRFLKTEHSNNIWPKMNDYIETTNSGITDDKIIKISPTQNPQFGMVIISTVQFYIQSNTVNKFI